MSTPNTHSLNRRDFLRQATIGLGALAVAACQPVAVPPAGGEETAGGAAPSAAAVTLSFLTQGGTQVAFDRYEPLIDNFQEANSNITVEPIWEPGGAIEVQTKLLTLIAAGDAPDIYWAHSYTNAGQAKRNLQMDLNPLIESDPNVNADDFLLAAWKDFQIEGKQIGFPRETTSTIIIYNKELFDKHSLPLPTDDWTWDDFLNAATTITEGEGPDRIFGTADWNLNRNTWIKMWQKGGDVVNESRDTYIMNQEPSVSQVKQIQSWHHDLEIHLPSTVVEAGGFTTGDLFTTGRIGMFPQYSVFSNVLASEFEWDIAHLPTDPDDIRTTRVASAGHSMYSGTENQDAAWKWIAYLASEEAFRNFVETGLSIPSLKKVAEDSKFMDPDQPPAHAQIMLDAFEYGRPEPVSGDWIGVHREVQPALDSIYGIEQADVQATLDSIASRVNELIGFVPGS